MQLFFDIIKSFVIGVVQGITEWLPVSSTGHIILFEKFLNFNSQYFTADFAEMFEVVIQFGSILAVLLLFFNKLNPFSAKKDTVQKKETLSLWSKVIVAVIPAAVIGLIFDDLLDQYLYNVTTVSATLIIYGILFIFVENYNRRRKSQTTSLDKLSYKTAFIIGAFQILALIPGTSRSGSTILGAIILGCSRYVAAEFSFFLAIPVMFGASGLKIFKFFLEGNMFSMGQFIILLIGMVVSFIVSVFAIRFLMNFVKKHNFKIFGYYRILLGIILIILMLLGLM